MVLPISFSLELSRRDRNLVKKQKGKQTVARKITVDLSKLKYADLLGVHELWKEYWNDVGNCSLDKEVLLKADLHGSLMKVVKANNQTQIGVTGIVVRETRNTFIIIKINDSCVCIPKQGSTFEFVVQGYRYTIFGDNLRATAVGRLQKKIKNSSLPYLIYPKNTTCITC